MNPSAGTGLVILGAVAIGAVLLLAKSDDGEGGGVQPILIWDATSPNFYAQSDQNNILSRPASVSFVESEPWNVVWPLRNQSDFAVTGQVTVMVNGAVFEQSPVFTVPAHQQNFQAGTKLGGSIYPAGSYPVSVIGSEMDLNGVWHDVVRFDTQFNVT